MDPVGIFINIHLIGGIPTPLKMAINFVSFPIKNGDFQCEFHPGWWLTYPSEKYTFVRLDHHPNYWEKKNSCSKPPTSHQYSIIWVKQ